MEKKMYEAPSVSVIDLYSTQMLCASDVVNQGGNNKPAGAPKRRSSFDDVDW